MRFHVSLLPPRPGRNASIRDVPEFTEPLFVFWYDIVTFANEFIFQYATHSDCVFS